MLDFSVFEEPSDSLFDVDDSEELSDVLSESPESVLLSLDASDEEDEDVEADEEADEDDDEDDDALDEDDEDDDELDDSFTRSGNENVLSISFVSTVIV